MCTWALDALQGQGPVRLPFPCCSLLFLSDLFLDEHGLLIAGLDPSMSHSHHMDSPATPSAKRHLFP